MVDNKPARQALDLRLDLGQLATIELDVGVPAEAVHFGNQRVHHVEAKHAAVQGHDAQRADAALGEPLELGVGDLRLHDRYALRAFSNCFYGFQGDAVVVAVGIRLDDDHALKAEPALQLAVHRHGESARIR